MKLVLQLVGVFQEIRSIYDSCYFPGLVNELE